MAIYVCSTQTTTIGILAACRLYHIITYLKKIFKNYWYLRVWQHTLGQKNKDKSNVLVTLKHFIATLFILMRKSHFA